MNRDVLRAATAQLAQAGVPSPEHDAGALLAHVLGIARSRLPVAPRLGDRERARYDDLLRRRARREPLQHLLGSAAFRYVELAVGPGVFVPRPETEALAGWAVDRAREVSGRRPVVADLGTGSGAIALSVATEVPSARVYAVELSEDALVWADRNLAGSGVDLRLGDLATSLEDLDGTVDVVVSNPPYIPHDAYASVAPEARDHDPGLALWGGGEDGLDALRSVASAAQRLLRRGGVVGAEHAEVQQDTAVAVFSSSGRWAEVRDHADLAGRPRFVTARLAR